MQRHRQIAAAPERGTSETWEVLAELIAATLERAKQIDRTEVVRALETVRAVGIMLIAGAHTESQPIVLRAEPVDLSITTVSGDGALTLDENLEPVLGATTATNWTLYLPDPEPVTDAVRAAVAKVAHVMAGTAPESTQKSAMASTGGDVLDREALLRRAGGGR